jgi:hypothetical protein
VRFCTQTPTLAEGTIAAIMQLDVQNFFSLPHGGSQEAALQVTYYM